MEWEEYPEQRYDKERGVHYLLTYFQCDLCHFRKIYRNNTDTKIPDDDILMVTIWRELLDDFWIRDTGTLRGNQSMLKKPTVTARE